MKTERIQLTGHDGRSLPSVLWLPILLLSGQDDPVGDFGKGVTAVKQAMDKAGLTHVELRLFPHARHDLLHETSSGCAEQVRTILASWILTHI